VLDSKKNEQGMSLVEILIVMTLIAFLFRLAIPSLTSTRRQSRIIFSNLEKDIKSASDTAVLTGQVYRMVFDFKSNQYWLEKTKHKNFNFSQFKRNSLLEQKDENREEKEKAKLKNYEELAGIVVKNKKGKELPLPSAVVVQMKKRTRIKWEKVTERAWADERSFGKFLMIKSIKTERLIEPLERSQAKKNQTLQASVLIMPSGKLETTVLHIYHKYADEIDETKKPYSFYIDSEQGVGFQTGLLNFDEKGQLK